MADDTRYRLKTVVTESGGNYTLDFYIDLDGDGDFNDAGEHPLSNCGWVDVTWTGGRVGLYRATSSTTTTLQWDDFICGYDDGDDDIGTVASPDAGDDIYVAYDFDGGTWQELTLTHDDNGNLTSDGLLKYEYDPWNRLVKARYDNGVDSADPVIAAYEYDGLFRRIEKTVTHQGTGVVYGSDGGGNTGIQAGNRHEHYFYTGWRLIETRDNFDKTLNQFVYGTQYTDEPVVYDRNLDADTDNDCLETGESADARYFYHQDANFRVVMLTDESGQVVERYRYTAYGEPTVYGGYNSTVATEDGRAMLTSSVGNPFQHQALFRDTDIGSYQNRFRQYHARLGRFMQHDPLGYADGMSMYEYLASNAVGWLDPYGLKLILKGTPKQRDRLCKALQHICPGVTCDKKGNVHYEPPKPPESQPASDCGDTPTTQPAKGPPPIPPGCKLIQKLINSSKTYKVRTGRVKGNAVYDPKSRTITISLALKDKLRPADPNADPWRPESWETLLEELIHAADHEAEKKITPINPEFAGMEFQKAQAEYDAIREWNRIVQEQQLERSDGVIPRRHKDDSPKIREARDKGWTPGP